MGFAAELFTKCSKGIYGDEFSRNVINELVLQNLNDISSFCNLLKNLPTFEQQKVLGILLALMAEKFLNSLDGDCNQKDLMVSSAAGVIMEIVGTDKVRNEYLITWLTSNSGAGLGDGIGIRRAVIATLAKDCELLNSALEKIMSLFGDIIYIKHAPILQQEVHAQCLLLLAGYVHRLAPIKLSFLLRGTTFLNSVSNRLGAPALRARFLGMVVGEALSNLVDVGKRKLDFHMNEMNTEEAKWYKSLVSIQDKIGDKTLLGGSQGKKYLSKTIKISPPLAKTSPTAPSNPGSAPTDRKLGFASDVAGNVKDEWDCDLKPYPRPVDDPVDDEDDPELIRRDRPTPPVYVRDLISYLRNTESYDHQSLALKHAAGIIRRKAHFGSEISSHANELASILSSLDNSKFEIDGFDELRLGALTALISALPEKMGTKMVRLLFEADFNAAQRSTVLVALGMAGREVAGLEVTVSNGSEFVSNRLPEQVEKMFLGGEDYNEIATPRESSSIDPGDSKNIGRRKRQLRPLPPTALDSITTSLSQKFLSPMAAEAADNLSGPDGLKVAGSYKSRFASSLSDKPVREPSSLSSFPGLSPTQVSRRADPSSSHSNRRTAVVAIPNTTSARIAAHFFSPLSSHLFPLVRTRASTSRFENTIRPVLPLVLRTLAVLMHAAGPNTLALPQLTGELWQLLLASRPMCKGDLALTSAVVEALVVLLFVNGLGPNSNGGTDAVRESVVKEFCLTFGSQMVETSEWMDHVFSSLRGGVEPHISLGVEKSGPGGPEMSDRNEEARVKAMAAGILVRLSELSERFKDLMLGVGLG